MADASQKLAIVLKPMLSEMSKDIKEHNTAVNQETLMALERLSVRMDVLEKLVSEKRKAAAPRDKKPAEGAAPVASPTETVITPPAGTTKTFATNKRVYFRDRYKNDPDYRAKWVTKELQDVMDKDPSIASKPTEALKLTAQSTLAWNYIKDNQKEIAEGIEKEYQAAKAAWEAANKPPQQTAEQHTPPADK